MAFNMNVGSESMAWQPNFIQTPDGEWQGRLTISVDAPDEVFKAVRDVFMQAVDASEEGVSLADIAKALGAA